MQTTYRLNTQELNLAFLKSIKILMPNQEVELTLKSIENSIDETTLMAESSLAIEWNSPEDNRWDNLL